MVTAKKFVPVPVVGEEWFVVYRGVPAPQTVECALVEEVTQYTVVLRRVADSSYGDRVSIAVRYLIKDIRFIERVGATC